MWSSIENDLDKLSTQVAKLDELGLLSFLVEVMAYVSLDGPSLLFERCSELLSRLRHLESQEPWAFDKVDEQEHRAQVWRAANEVPTAIREAVRDAWLAPAAIWKKTMVRAAAWATDDPVSALFKVDHANLFPECLQILASFQSLLEECQPKRTADYPPGLIRGVVREFLLKNGRENYAAMRPELIRLLIREVIDPQELVRACVIDSALAPRALVEHISTDPTLRLVWRTVFACEE